MVKIGYRKTNIKGKLLWKHIVDRRNKRIRKEEKFLEGCQDGKRVRQDQVNQEDSGGNEGTIRREIGKEEQRREEKRSLRRFGSIIKK